MEEKTQRKQETKWMVSKSVSKVGYPKKNRWHPEFLRGFTDPFSLELNKFLDDFLLSRLGCNMLLGQYLACTSNSHITSIVNPQCDAFEICQKAAEEVILGRVEVDTSTDMGEAETSAKLLGLDSGLSLFWWSLNPKNKPKMWGTTQNFWCISWERGEI